MTVRSEKGEELGYLFDGLWVQAAHTCISHGSGLGQLLNGPHSVQFGYFGYFGYLRGGTE